jgi:chloramphenicol-sensitive protein RarD
MLGMVQYLSPSLQLVLAVWYFKEPFDSQRLVGFVLIWSALLLISGDALRTRHRAVQAAGAAA